MNSKRIVFTGLATLAWIWVTGWLLWLLIDTWAMLPMLLTCTLGCVTLGRMFLEATAE